MFYGFYSPLLTNHCSNSFEICFQNCIFELVNVIFMFSFCFQITCNCGENIVLDSISRGLGKDMRLALYDCPNVQCQKHHPLIEKIGLIKNLLTKAMRLHIQKYYSGWIVCEDPGCSGRTRRCPLSFQRAFPICNTCFKATMYRYVYTILTYNLFFYSMNVIIHFFFS